MQLYLADVHIVFELEENSGFCNCTGPPMTVDGVPDLLHPWFVVEQIPQVTASNLDWGNLVH